MKPGGFRIDAIRAKDLQSFLADYTRQGAQQRISPISQYRALSQSKNPYADDEDIGLLVAYLGDLCVGYQGILPGRLRTVEGDSKVYWCTAAYVIPEFRKRMVAIQLIKKLVSLKQDIVLTGFDGVVAEVFRGLHFREMQPLQHMSLRADRLDLFSYPFRRFYRLQKRWPAFRRAAESAIKLSRDYCYPTVRTAFYRSLSKRADKALEGIEWHELSRVEPSSPKGHGLTAEAASFPRDSEVINWMLDYPWIHEGPAPTQPPYYFSETYPQFRYVVLGLGAPGDKSRGHLVLSLVTEKGESKLKVLDQHVAKDSRGALFWLICKQAAKYQVDEIELPGTLNDYAGSLPFASFLLKRKQRRYLCHPRSDDSPLGRALKAITLDLSDADCAFT